MANTIACTALPGATPSRLSCFVSIVKPVFDRASTVTTRMIATDTASSVRLICDDSRMSRIASSTASRETIA